MPNHNMGEKISLLPIRISTYRKGLELIERLLQEETSKPFKQRRVRVLVLLAIERRICKRILAELETLYAENGAE
jgi:hypothetical protein